MDEEFEGLRANKVYFLDTNLSSPVLNTEIRDTYKLFQDYRSTVRADDRSKTFSTQRRNDISFFRRLCKLRGWKSQMLLELKPLDPFEYAILEQEFLKTPVNAKGFYPEAQKIALEIQNAVADGLSARGLPREGIIGTAEALCSDHCRDFRIAYEEFCNLYGRAESRTKYSDSAWTLGAIGAAKVWISPKNALFEFSGKMRYGSANQVLMLKDKLATRYMLLEHVTPLRTGEQLIPVLRQLFKWQDDTLSRYGNEAYDILKAVEPLFKTRLSHIASEGIFGHDTAYNRMIVKMLDKERSVLKRQGKEIEQIPVAIPELCKLVESVGSLSHLVEMFGCQKSCGHPIIDPCRGGLSAAMEALTPDVTSFTDAQRLRNTFCQIILHSYVEKHGRWPKGIRFTKPGLKLQVLHNRQERDLSDNSYPLDDWTYTEWGKIFEMDYFPNFLELMDDKSISFYRSEKHLTWDEGKPSTQRRLLLEVLRSEEINIKEIVERVSRRDIPWDWLIVSLYPKEREFKLDPRMFAMLVLQMRCFFTCIEANIADHVFKYMPQQTMTKSQTQVQEKFLAMTDPHKNVNSHTLFLEIDLSRWNLKWRELVIHMIGHDLNNMFGVAGTFTVTHWFFKKCQIVVRVPGLRPDGIEKDLPPISSLAWREHLGGFEGLNQKLWTAATFAMIKMALADLVQGSVISSYELAGQGDNQVLRISIPKGDDSKAATLVRVRDMVNHRLETTCASVGQIVKADENVEAPNVLTYSKNVYIDGVEYPTTLKKHSRLFPVTASDFPSTTAKASAIMAGAVAGAENSRHTLCSAVVGWYHAARYLLSTSAGYSIHGNESPRFSSASIIAALVIPPSIGGMIGTPIASFIYKGGSDPLGKEISSLKLIAESTNRVGVIAGRALRALEDKYCFTPTPNIELLIDNPYGLPLDKVTSPLGQVSHLTLEAFRGRVVNKDIKPLLDKSVEDSEKLLKDDILKIRPLNPVLAHDLFEASGFGTIKEMRKMFLNTRTVQAVSQWVNPNITHTFLRADINDIKWFFSWLKGLPKLGYSGKSSFDICQKARQSWGTTLAGVTNYQPLDYHHLPNSVRSDSSIKWSAHAGGDLLYKRGVLSGYHGSTVKHKFSEHGFKIVDSGAPSRAMMKLQTVRSQANGNIELNELLDRIGLTRTNCKLSTITDVLQKVIGGSMAHKYQSTVRSMAAAYVGPLNFITHIRLDTDSLGKVSGGTDNFSIMLQEFMVASMAGAKLLYMHNGVVNGELVIDTHMMEPIPDDNLIAEAPMFRSASLPKSRLLYTPDLMLRRTFDNAVRVVPRGSVASSESYSNREVIHHAATGFFVDLLRDQSRAKQLADTRGLTAIPAKYQIDIAEAHALGPLILARCMAKALWISNLRDTFRTSHLYPDRWDEALYLTHNIMACVKACANYLTHPMRELHPDSRRLRSSGLRYSDKFSIQKRMSAQVKRFMVQIYRDERHPFWSEDVPVFSSENSMTLVECLSVAAIKKVYPLYMIGDPQAAQKSSLLASYTRVDLRGTMSAGQQLEVLRLRLTKLAVIYRKMGDYLLADEIAKTAHLKGLLVFNDDVKTVLRYSRNLTIDSLIPRPRKILRPGFPPLDSADVCPRCLPPPLQRHRLVWEKNAVRKHGGIAAAGYTWLPLFSSIRVMKSVLIVGSGNGGLADALLTCFDCEVLGIDLESDMPRDAATLLNYVPVGVRPENSQSYTQSDLCLSTTGDWYDQAVRHEILESLHELSTVFIDITVPDSHRADAVGDCLKKQQIDTVLTRIVGNKDFVLSQLSELVALGQVKAWCSGHTHHSLELIVEVRRSDIHYDHTCGQRRHLFTYVTEQMHEVIEPRLDELIEAATLSTLAPECIDSLSFIKAEIDSLCSSLLNKSRSRQLLYRDRIDLVWAHITMQLSVLPDPWNELQNWIAEEEIETSLLRFSVRDSIITHLVRYVPRLRLSIPI